LQVLFLLALTHLNPSRCTEFYPAKAIRKYKEGRLKLMPPRGSKDNNKQAPISLLEILSDEQYDL
jgi:hypothetical protein